AASGVLWRHFEGRPVAGTAGGDHHVVDRSWEILEERLQGGRIVGVEGRDALRVELERCLLEALGIAPGEDDAGALGAGSPGALRPDAAAAADDNDGLAEQFRIALGGYSSGCGGHGSSVGWGERHTTLGRFLSNFGRVWSGAHKRTGCATGASRYRSARSYGCVPTTRANAHIAPMNEHALHCGSD